MRAKRIRIAAEDPAVVRERDDAYLEKYDHEHWAGLGLQRVLGPNAIDGGRRKRASGE